MISCCVDGYRYLYICICDRCVLCVYWKAPGCRCGNVCWRTKCKKFDKLVKLKIMCAWGWRINLSKLLRVTRVWEKCILEPLILPRKWVWIKNKIVDCLPTCPPNRITCIRPCPSTTSFRDKLSRLDALKLKGPWRAKLNFLFKTRNLISPFTSLNSPTRYLMDCSLEIISSRSTPLVTYSNKMWVCVWQCVCVCALSISPSLPCPPFPPPLVSFWLSPSISVSPSFSPYLSLWQTDWHPHTHTHTQSHTQLCSSLPTISTGERSARVNQHGIVHGVRKRSDTPVCVYMCVCVLSWSGDQGIATARRV